MPTIIQHWSRLKTAPTIILHAFVYSEIVENITLYRLSLKLAHIELVI
jgi:hypothetical protein